MIGIEREREVIGQRYPSLILTHIYTDKPDECLIKKNDIYYSYSYRLCIYEKFAIDIARAKLVC